MQKCLLAGLIAFISVTSSFGQSPTLGWTGGFQGAGNQDVQTTAVDAAGNVYVAGGFEGTVDFDPSPASFKLTSAGGKDAFIASYTASGQLITAKQFGAATNDEFYAIAIDGSNKLYVSGYFSGSVDFDPSAATLTLTATGGVDAFIGVYTTSLALQWRRHCDF